MDTDGTHNAAMTSFLDRATLFPALGLLRRLDPHRLAGRPPRDAGVA